MSVFGAIVRMFFRALEVPLLEIVLDEWVL
jgi:hypothetical protein